MTKKLSPKEKTAIRAHYPHWKLRFLDNGIVLGQKTKGSPFGVLYTAEQAEQHIQAIK